MILGLILSGRGHAQEATLDLPEQTLNRMIDRVGVLSDGGVAQPYSTHEAPELFRECFQIGYLACPGLQMYDLGLGQERIPLVACRKVGGGVVTVPVGEPVAWQWWITDAHIELSAGAMRFTATVTSNVGDHWDTVTRTVGALVDFDKNTNKLMIKIDPYRVPLQLGGGSSASLDVEPVDVAKYFSLAVPIVPQQISVPLPNGSSRNLTGKVVKARPTYSQDNLMVTFDVCFVEPCP